MQNDFLLYLCPYGGPKWQNGSVLKFMQWLRLYVFTRAYVIPENCPSYGPHVCYSCGLMRIENGAPLRDTHTHTSADIAITNCRSCRRLTETMSCGGWVDMVCFYLGSSKLYSVTCASRDSSVMYVITHAFSSRSSLIDARSAVSTHLNYVIDI